MMEKVDQTFAEKVKILYEKYHEAYEGNLNGGTEQSFWYAKGGMEAIKNVIEMYCSGDFRQEHSVCPFRKTTTITEVGTIEDFGECYGKECPFFVAGRCKRGNAE